MSQVSHFQQRLSSHSVSNLHTLDQELEKLQNFPDNRDHIPHSQSSTDLLKLSGSIPDLSMSPKGKQKFFKWRNIVLGFNNNNTSGHSDLTSRLSSTYGASFRASTRREKMIYFHKFGEFGINEGQFTEPSGVAVTAQNDIVVADTNNHRIQVFDKEGHFKFMFGECGKRDGQLLYPNRVAVNKITGDFVVTERSPTHQIQVFNQFGQFLRKFGANILQHPRGVCVDYQGRIVVVECKVRSNK